MPEISQRVHTRLRRYVLLRALLWWIVIAVSLLWNWHQIDQTLQAVALTDAARTILKQNHIRDLAWVHAGVWLVGLLGFVIMAWRMSRNEAERERAEDEARTLWRAVEHSSAIVVLTDLNANIEHVNPRFVEVTGYTEEEVKGRNPRVLQSGVHPPEFYQELWKTITAGHVWQGTFCNKRKNGQRYWESASISPIRDANGNITHYVAIKEDITAQKETETALKRAKEAADAASAAKSDFLANMSHEIRTPMNAIIGMNHLIQRTGLNPQQADYSGKIETAAQALLRIINDILDFEKIEASRLELENIEFELDDVFANLADLSALRAQGKRLELVIAAAPTTPRHLMGDPLRLGQVLLNLTHNAIKFTEAGEVVVAVEPVANTPLPLKGGRGRGRGAARPLPAPLPQPLSPLARGEGSHKRTIVTSRCASRCVTPASA